MIPYDAPAWFVLSYLFIFGAVVGSFLNVCIYRIPMAEQRWYTRHPHLRGTFAEWADNLWAQLSGLWSPPSSCPRCGKQILSRDNVPILGWLWLRGRCRNCRAKISPRYPLIEAFNGCVFVALYWYEIPLERWAGYDENPLFLSAFHSAPMSHTAAVTTLHLRWLYHLILVEALIVATFIDFDLMIIPDGATIPAMAVGVLGGWAAGNFFLVPLWFEDPSLAALLRGVLPEWMIGAPPGVAHGVWVPAWISAWPHLHGLAVSVAGLLVGGGIVWAVRVIGHWALGKEAMGFGDVVLMAMIGSFIGWQPVVIVFFVAPVCALSVVALMWIFRRAREIPYGPYLSLGTVIVLFAWQPVWEASERIFSMGALLPMFGAFTAVALAICLQAMQLVKKLLGITDPEEPLNGEWMPADQLQYLAGENVDPDQGRWRRQEHRTWPGTSSGRGLGHETRWRHGSQSRQ